jgi:nucleotide-binding universal stress UspA family protein
VINHILVPLDGSSESEQALSYAASLAEAYGGARVTLLAVMLRFPETRIQSARMDERSEQRAWTYLKEIIAKHPSTFPIEAHVRLGVPADEIAAEALLEGVDLIVMTTHGTAGTERDRHSIGSTAWRVLHDTPCPVFLVPARAS